MTADLKEQVLAKLNFANVFGEYVQLRKAGKSLTGLCPFHQEKTPSFHVNAEKGFYHCFGCKAGGDVFDFVMKMEGLTFPESLALLARRVGLDNPTPKAEVSPQARLRRAILDVNELANSFFQRTLLGPMGENARKYLRRRGIDQASIRHFDLGYAPDRWDGLTGFLIDSGKEEVGLQAGLLGHKRTNGAYDRFRDRIIFPVTNAQGQVVAFGGRLLGPGEPKYLNSPENVVYEKRKELYGFSQAKEAMRRSQQVILVEGYFDCLALYRSGMKNVVASCGTALTGEHIKSLRRFVTDVYLCFDADRAGRQAVTKAAEVLRGSQLQSWVIDLPDGFDPDSFIVEHGAQAFESQLENALPLIEYLLEGAMAKADESVAGRMQAVRAALPILRGLESAVEREAYIQKVATRLGVSSHSLTAEVVGKKVVNDRQLRHTNEPPRDTTKGAEISGRGLRLDGRSLVEREMIRCLVHDASGVSAAIEELGPTPFRTQCYNQLLRALGEGQCGVAAVKTLQAEIGSESISALLQPPDHGLSWEDYVARLRCEQLRTRLRKIEEGLATLVENNPVEYMRQMSNGLLAFRKWRQMWQSYCRTQSEAS